MDIDKTYLHCFGNLSRRRATRGVVIHHTCTRNAEATRRVLKEKGYSTHFEVTQDGHIYQYAPLDRKCIQCGSNNHQTVSVDLTHVAGAAWPDAQIAAAKELLRWLSDELNLPLVLYKSMAPGFYFHRAIGDTACPQDPPVDDAFELVC